MKVYLQWSAERAWIRHKKAYTDWKKGRDESLGPTGNEFSDLTGFTSMIPQHLVSAIPAKPNIPVGVYRCSTANQTPHGGSVVKYQPCSQVKYGNYHRVLVFLRRWLSRSMASLQGSCDCFSCLGQVSNMVQSFYDEGRSKVSCASYIWQKPGIGVAAISPVPVRGIRWGKGN